MTHLQEAAPIVRTRLKKEFPSCKFSVRQETASLMWCLNVSLMSAPFAALTDNAGYHQLNRYQFDDRRRDPSAPYYNNGRTLTKDAFDVMKRAVEITCDVYPPDGQMCFVSFAIGHWKRPYSIKTRSR